MFPKYKFLLMFSNFLFLSLYIYIAPCPSQSISDSYHTEFEHSSQCDKVSARADSLLNIHQATTQRTGGSALINLLFVEKDGKEIYITPTHSFTFQLGH